MAEQFPLLTDDEANELWRSTLGAPYQGRKLAFQLIRATESATRAPLLAEIERLKRELEITRDSASKSASLVDVSILVEKANARILAKERDARRAAQEQVEKLQAEVARLEPMRQRADDTERLTAELKDAKRGQTVALDLVSHIRWAVGDHGARMQPELIEYLKQMRTDAERYRWLRSEDTGDHAVSALITSLECGQYTLLDGKELDAAIDAARKEPTNG